MHNVLCDIYVRVGWLPLLALVLALACCLPPALVQLRRALGSTEAAAPALLLAGVLITLAVQWLFQPLLYADGLLFFLGFLLLGFLAAARLDSDNQADQARPPCPPRSRAT
jgi:O-antigen ligase